jgi:hypothetical protein
MALRTRSSSAKREPALESRSSEAANSRNSSDVRPEAQASFTSSASVGFGARFGTVSVAVLARNTAS